MVKFGMHVPLGNPNKCLPDGFLLRNRYYKITIIVIIILGSLAKALLSNIFLFQGIVFGLWEITKQTANIHYYHNLQMQQTGVIFNMFLSLKPSRLFFFYLFSTSGDNSSSRGSWNTVS